jgi:hypothetical protein
MVEPQSPHRITNTWVTGPVPGNLTPRLPMDFTDYPIAGSSGRQLIVFSGLSSSGKSTLVDAVGQALQIPGLRVRSHLRLMGILLSRRGCRVALARAPAPDRRVGV